MPKLPPNSGQLLRRLTRQQRVSRLSRLVS